MLQKYSFSLVIPLFALNLFFASPAYATYYAPGATLDPTCAPTDPGCGIATSTASVGAGIQGQVPYYAANGSALTATSSMQILQNGTVSVAGALAVGDASTTRSNLGLQYATTTDLVFNPGVAAWGDSITYGYGANSDQSYPAVLGTLFGGNRTIYNGGVSGQYSAQIRDRMLAATDKSNYTTVILAGYNNVAYDNATTTVESDIAIMVKSLGSNKRYLVLSIINGSNELSGSYHYQTITKINSDLAARYPGHYLDIRSYLINQGLSDAGIATSTQDQIDYNNDIVPTDLRADSIHPNAAGYALIAQQVFNFIETNLDQSSLNLPVSATLVTSLNLQTLFASPPSIGGASPNSGTFTSVSAGVFDLNGIPVLSATSTNFAAGFYSLLSDTTGTNNTALGYQTLSANTTGSTNTAVGSSLISNTTGSDNTATGYGSLYLNTIGTQNTATGIRALYANVSGSTNTASGYQALWSNKTGGLNSAFGAGALAANISGSYNLAIGINALSVSTTTSFITAIGGAALAHNTTGTQNTALGYGSLDFTTTGSNNTGAGYQVLLQNTTGASNAAFGQGTMLNNITGSFNVAVGTGALAAGGSATNTVAIGYSAGSNAGTTQGNVMLGYRAGANSVTGADYGTLLGYQAGYSITTGTRNILIGPSTIAASFGQVTTGSDNIAIGNDVAVPSPTASNQLVIGNLIYGTGLNGTGMSVSTGNLGIGTTSPATRLELGTGSLTLDSYLNCSGFTTNANGLVACTASDQRLKQDIAPLDASSTLASLNTLSPVSFYWKPETDRGTQQQYGLIAQQVAGVFPMLVSTTSPTSLTPDGTLTVNYDGLIAPMLVAVQQLSKDIQGFAQSITTNVVNSQQDNTQKLCVGSTCVTEAQLKVLLQTSNQGVVIAPIAPPSDDTSSTTPVVPPAVESTTTDPVPDDATDAAPIDTGTATDTSSQ